MYVCICKNVTEKDIKRAVREGACSISCLQSTLGVATGCGECRVIAKEILENAVSCSDSFPLAQATA
ncbi:MAG: bacterioferritin-associated ferredoxin [Gammaproteobacteria bacterium]|jgi:bacterioferritin-associated ferredoxin